MPHLTAVLIPGLVSDDRVWAHVAAELSGFYAVHLADVRRDSTIQDMATRLLDELDGDLVAIGHSMGGRVAMEMAHQAPDRLRGMVLANTGHDARKPGEIAKRQAKIDLGYADMRRLAAEWLPPMLAPDRLDDRALVADLTDMVVTAGPQVHERQIRALIHRPEATAYIPDIACPILLMTGAQDAWSPETQHREIVALARDAELQVVDNAGHFMPVEQPRATARCIADWMTRRLNRHEEQRNG